MLMPTLTGFRPVPPLTEDSLQQLLLKLKQAQHKELGISLPNIRKVYMTKNWLIDRLYQVVRSFCNGEKITAEDVYYILMHFAGQFDYAKVFFLFTLFNSDKESDAIRDDLLIFRELQNIRKVLE